MFVVSRFFKLSFASEELILLTELRFPETASAQHNARAALMNSDLFITVFNQGWDRRRVFAAEQPAALRSTAFQSWYW